MKCFDEDVKSASAYETDVRVLPFFAIISRTLGEDS
jgi:hypothetical protein